MMAGVVNAVLGIDFQQLNYMSRGCSTILYHVISLSAMCSAVYLFGRRSIDYTLYGMCGANCCIVLGSIKENGIGAFVTGLIAFAKSGGIDTNAAIKALEVHDLTFAFGLMLLFALCCERGKKRLLYAALSGLFFFLGLKRIALIGLVGVFLMGEFIRRRKPKVQSVLILLISIGAIVICFGYVYLIQSGLFNEIVHALEIDTMGRDRLYAAFQEVYDFSPAFRGYGIGYVTRYISIMTEAGVGVFGTHNFGGMHNDIVTMYIELGAWGFSRSGFGTAERAHCVVPEGSGCRQSCCCCTKRFLRLHYLRHHGVLLLYQQSLLLPDCDGDWRAGTRRGERQA